MGQNSNLLQNIGMSREFEIIEIKYEPVLKGR